MGYEGGNCSVIVKPTSGHLALGVTSGWMVVSFNTSDVINLADYACLNGWTMGNIALTTLDSVKFLHTLLVDRSPVSPASLEQMMQFRGFGGGGFTPGPDAGYGLGLMKTSVHFPVKGWCPPPLCNCSGSFCKLNLTTIGHAGVDWGSDMFMNGHILQLEASVSIAFNALHGLNSSLTVRDNMMLISQVQCVLFDALSREKFPNFPGLNCEW